MVAPSELPSADTQRQVANYKLLDRDGKELLFRDIINGPDAPDRTLVIFVRHFFCGSCQEYLQRLCAAIPPEKLPASTSIAVVGCGDPSLIPYYAAETGCPYPMYCDPTRGLYDALGMINTWDVGPQPSYISKSVPRLALEGIYTGLSHLWSGKTFKAGPGKQQGGEFLFERSKPEEGGEKRVTWCHRMQRSWGHAEIEVMSDVIHGRPVDQDSLRKADE
ncbi:peroxiredoxin-like family protein [Aspergillus undulatus]|uniref:peroxiredoxin-like family protein n=1 Tax=Aspergillus undulatus TaxID=1810928 RepID=UPI003CCCD969